MNVSTIYTTAEELHATAENIIKALNADEVAEKLRAPREVWKIYNIWEAAAKLRDEAAEAMRRESAKQSKRASVYAAAMRILKDANTNHREALHGANRSEDGYIDICDGFRLLRLDASTAPELPARPESLPPYVDAARLYKLNAENHADPVKLPEPATLREFIKITKARRKAEKSKDKTPPLWKATTDAGAVIWFNACFLLDMIEALPSAKAYADANTAAAPLRCVIFEADNGRGLILPVRPPQQ